jgi:ADP-ribose pyrophosphatase YjhB (NUDIX family)
MRFLPDDTYALVEQSIPIACVDFVPERWDYSGARGQKQFGLIRRQSPFGEVWCHLGGRIGRGESIREALLRHADDTLGVRLLLPADPQPSYVYQWFPPDDRPADASVFRFGDDPRKHAIGLSFTVDLDGDPRPRNEALAFDWFSLAELPTRLWPGARELLYRLSSSSRDEDDFEFLED